MTTGASGVLGTQVCDAFAQAGHEVVGLAHSRATGKLKQVDLLDEAKTNDVFSEFQPHCKCVIIHVTRWHSEASEGVIHCAAERRPDVAEKVCCRRSCC